MSQILLVKTSSLGDVVHNLPVVSDIRRHFPDAQIDWVLEQGFAFIARMHPALRRALGCDLRLWLRTWWRSSTRTRWRDFDRLVRSVRYDTVVDTQGLLKSALVTWRAHGCRVGLDW